MWLPVEVTTPPAEEPVTIEEARAQVQLDEGDDSHDGTLNIYIKAARVLAQNETGTRLITQTVLMKANCFADFKLLPIAALQAVTAITYLDSDGTEQTLDPATYDAVLVGDRPFIRLKAGQSWPSTLAAPDAVRVVATAGYGADGAAVAVQAEPVRLAMLLWIGGWFRDREASAPVSLTEIPNGTPTLLKDHRRFRGM